MFNIENLKEHLAKPEVQEAIKKFKEHQEFLDELKNEYLAWFDSIGAERRNHYIQKVIKKYTSDSYKDRWYNRGIFPPEELYWWIYDYAYKYGKCWNPSTNEVGPGYAAKFVFDDWKVIRYDGQGSIVIISKITDEDIKRGPDTWAQSLLGKEYSDYYESLTDEFE